MAWLRMGVGMAGERPPACRCILEVKLDNTYIDVYMLKRINERLVANRMAASVAHLSPYKGAFHTMRSCCDCFFVPFFSVHIFP